MKNENVKLLINLANKVGFAVIEVENALENKIVDNFNTKLNTARKLIEELTILRVELQNEQTLQDSVKGLFGIGLLAKCDRYIKNIDNLHTSNEHHMLQNAN